jgi:hypothetical protein
MLTKVAVLPNWRNISIALIEPGVLDCFAAAFTCLLKRPVDNPRVEKV